MKPKRFRRVLRQEVKRETSGLWVALCKNPLRVRAVLAWRLLIGKPYGVRA